MAATRPEIRFAASWISAAIAANRAAGGRRAENRAERRSADRRRDAIERLHRHRRSRRAARRPRRRRRDRRASRRSRLRARACWMGDSTPAGRDGETGQPHFVHGGELRTGQRRAALAERARRLLGFLQPIAEQRGAAFDRRRRVVQFVRQSGRQLAERDHLLVVQAARREDPGAIEHLVHEDRRDLVTVANHLGEVVARDDENLRRFLGERVAGRADQARIGQHAGDVAGPRLEHLVPPGPAIDKDRNVAREHDEQARDRDASRAQHLALVEMAKRAVRDQPREFLAGRGAEGLVLGEPIDEIDGAHLCAP